MTSATVWTAGFGAPGGRTHRPPPGTSTCGLRSAGTRRGRGTRGRLADEVREPAGGSIRRQSRASRASGWASSTRRPSRASPAAPIAGDRRVHGMADAAAALGDDRRPPDQGDTPELLGQAGCPIGVALDEPRTHHGGGEAVLVDPEAGVAAVDLEGRRVQSQQRGVAPPPGQQGCAPGAIELPGAPNRAGGQARSRRPGRGWPSRAPAWSAGAPSGRGRGRPCPTSPEAPTGRCRGGDRIRPATGGTRCDPRGRDRCPRRSPRRGRP